MKKLKNYLVMSYPGIMRKVMTQMSILGLLIITQSVFYQGVIFVIKLLLLIDLSIQILG